MPRLSNPQRIELRFRALERAVAAGGGGGGGPAAWGSITGTLSAQTDLSTALGAKADAGSTTSALAGKADAAATTSALAGKADTAHTHVAADVTDFASVVATLTRPKTATLSVPARSFSHSQTITDAAVTPSSRILVSLGTMLPTDENEADMLDILALAAVPATGAFAVVANFASWTRGPIPILYTVN